MAPRARLALLPLLLALVLGPAYLYVSTHDVERTWREFATGRQHVTWPPPPKGGGEENPVETGDVLRPLRWACVVAFLVAAALALTRLHHRRRRVRNLQTWELGLGRDDLSNPYRIQEAFEGISGAITARWYERIWRGQDHIALEIHRLPDQSIRFTIAAPERLRPALVGPLEDLYPDVELRPVAGRPAWTQYIVRLKKRRPFVLSLQTTRNYEHAFAESLVALLGAETSEVTVQLVLCPAPIFMHARARRLLKRRERGLNASDRRDPAEPGVGSVVEAKELKGALETQHRSLVYFDLRVCGHDPFAVRRAAGLASQLRSENELVLREMRFRRTFYAKRIETALPNPLPGLRTGLLSTSELPTLWQLPRARVKHARLSRATVRRAVAPPEIERDTKRRLLEDERGAVSIGRADRKYGHALIGGQGGGKSSVLARHFLNDTNDPGRRVVLIDPKGPLAELCRGLAPEGRTVHYLDLGAPELGINPLAIDASPGARASVFVQALIEANPPGAIQAASDSFLRQAVFAVCSVEQSPTLWHVYKLLELGRSPYRESVVARLDRVPGADFARNYWSREFPALIGDKSFASQALNPPRNKLERLISTREIDICLRHPTPLDIEAALARSEVLIVNGAKAAVGEDNTVLVMQLLLQLLHRALQAEQCSPDGDRRPLSLLIDEAHNILTPSVAKMLAEGRSAGLEAVFAWQYSAQIRDEVIRSGVRSLLQSISIFRMREMEDARSLAGLAMEVYSDRISVDQEEQERLRFSPDDILKLPVHRAINLWVAEGIPRAGFMAQTLPMEGLHDPAVAEYHAVAQRDRGGLSPAHLPAPIDLSRIAPSSAPRPTQAPARAREPVPAAEEGAVALVTVDELAADHEAELVSEREPTMDSEVEDLD